jgi:hypothetical protein
MDAWADADGHERRQDRDRRKAERRATERGEHDRRRSLRRRTHLRNVIFTAMTLSVAPGLKHSELARSVVPRVLEARVLTSIDTVSLAIPPARAYDRLIREAGALYRVSPTLIRAVMQAESAFDRLAVSRAGAMGLMQLMPETAGAYEIVDPSTHARTSWAARGYSASCWIRITRTFRSCSPPTTLVRRRWPGTAEYHPFERHRDMSTRSSC